MKFATRELVAATAPLIVRTHKADKYGGRWDGEVLYQKDAMGAKDLSRELIAAGHAVPYSA